MTKKEIIEKQNETIIQLSQLFDEYSKAVHEDFIAQDRKISSLTKMIDSVEWQVKIAENSIQYWENKYYNMLFFSYILLALLYCAIFILFI